MFFTDDVLPVQVKKELEAADEPPVPMPVPPAEVKNTSTSTGQPPAKKAKLTGKKRDRTQACLPDGEDGSSLLSAEKLSAMSSKKLEEYAQNLAEIRPLTTEEEKQLKRQKRLIKNRESAQLSRQRKKHYVEELEAQVKALTAENQQLQTQMRQMSTKAQELQSQVIYWRGLSQQDQLAVVEDNKLFNSKNTAKAGLCMLVILFSFGLFMNTMPPHDTTALGLKAPSSSLYTGRTLHSLPDAHVVDAEEITLKRGPEFVQDLPSAKRAKVGEEGVIAPCPANDEPEARMTDSTNPDFHSSELVVSVPQSREPKANGSYVFCSEAQQVTNSYEGSQRVADSPLITFLLPADVLNGTLPLHSGDDSSLLEVSCQVLNISIFPWTSSELTQNAPESHLL